jgi:hypothetical protein
MPGLASKCYRNNEMLTAVESRKDQETEMILIVALMREELVARLAFSLSHVSCY